MIKRIDTKDFFAMSHSQAIFEVVNKVNEVVDWTNERERRYTKVVDIIKRVSKPEDGGVA